MEHDAQRLQDGDVRFWTDAGVRAFGV